MVLRYCLVSLFVFVSGLGTTAQVTIADAGPDQSVCATSAFLQGNTPGAGETGAWTLIAGPGIVFDPDDPASGVAGLLPCENQLAWTITDGVNSSSDTMTVFVHENVVADAGPDQELCIPPGYTTLEGNALPCQAYGFWAVVAGNIIIDNPSWPNSGAHAYAPGVSVLIYSIENTPCPITSDDLVIFAYDSTVSDADAGPDQVFCLPENSGFMAGSLVTYPGVGTWTLLSGQGTINDPNDPNSLITALAPGENVFQWYVNNGPCGVTSDHVSLYVEVCNGLVGSAAGIDLFLGEGSRSIRIGSAMLIDRVLLLDAQGRLVRSLARNGRSATMSIDDLPNGVYTVHVFSGGERLVRHVVVVR